MLKQPLMRAIIVVGGISLIIALFSYAYATITQSRYMTHMPVVINVTGEGEAFAKPDIASFTFAVRAEEKSAADAQKKSADGVNKILEMLKQNGVADKDIKTEYYNLTPRYEYPSTRCEGGHCPPSGARTLTGYEVSQGIRVKVRDTDTVGELIQKAGELGATDVSGPDFTIDDETILKAEAREKAVKNAKDNAEKLAKSLGMHIVRMTGYWEDEGGYPQPYAMKAQAMDSAVSAGAPSVPPQMPVGENTMTARVNMSYELR